MPRRRTGVTQCLAEEIRKLCEPEKYLKLLDDLKVRIRGLQQAGISPGVIQLAPGVQPGSLKAWSKTCKPALMPSPCLYLRSK